MTTENVKELIAYRLEQAEESLDAAGLLIEKELYRSSVNRSYYAMFYAALALLTREQKETSKHSGAISMFDREFVKKGSFEKRFSRWFHDAFDLRQRSDYAADVRITQEEASRTFEHGRFFVTEVKAFLQDKLK